VEFNTFVLFFACKMKEITMLVLSPKSCRSSKKDELRKVNFKPATK